MVQEDITGISELQPDMGAMATWLNTAWWVTPNEKREMMKFDKLEEPTFDEPWIATGIMPLTDALMAPEPESGIIEDENEDI